MKTQFDKNLLLYNLQKEIDFNPATHVFYNHELRKTNIEPLPVNKIVEYWPLLSLTLGLCLVVLLRISSPKKFFIIIKSFFSFSAAKQLMREDYKLNKGSSLILIVLFLINLAFFLLKINTSYRFITYSFSSIYLFFILLVIMIGLYSIKIIVLKVLEFITNESALGEEYIYYTFLSIKAMGLFLYPILVLLEYSNLYFVPLVFIGLFICLGLYLIRIVRGAQIIFNSGQVSFFHLFLYLCGLEIIPLIVLIKILMSGFLKFG